MSFFFYDVETSGLNPRDARVMQFAGQRTTTNLDSIDEPINVLIKMVDDVLPDPQAVLATGITPQQTLATGITEAEFLRLFTDEVATTDTIFVGYNTVRFDDEFMRYLHYRNFYDPYEWQWKDGRSRWDLLDVLRMTRALRPHGINWPIDKASGKPSNRLEKITAINKLDHANAHDALSDVLATIDLARLIRAKQPKLFDYLLGLRDKKTVAVMANAGQPFVYTSGKYPSEFYKTTVVATIAQHPNRSAVLVYDLRHDPHDWQDKTVEQLAEAWSLPRHSEQPRLPVKTLQFNRCPATAPLSVLDSSSIKRLGLDMELVRQHTRLLEGTKDFSGKVVEALELLDKKRHAQCGNSPEDIDAQLYDGFFNDHDRQLEQTVRATSTEQLHALQPAFDDKRLIQLLPLYKARNFPAVLSDEERMQWETFRSRRLLLGGPSSRMTQFMTSLQNCASQPNITSEQRFLLEELNLWAQSIMPEQSVE